jgi:iron complex transport system substrate-binding protein
MMNFWASFVVVLTVLAAFRPLASQATDRCERIVSTAPSVTELLFDLGLGSRLVGATEFCRYPSDALKVPRVGGYLDLNLERVVALKPSVVFGLKESEAALKPLERFNVETQLLDHTSLGGIRASYSKVAQICGISERAQMKLAAFAARERLLAESCRASRGSGALKRVMVVVGRTREGSADSGVYVSGSDGFYSDIVSLLGAVNVHAGRTVAVPSLSAEGIRALAPDVVIDIVNVDDPADERGFEAFWRQFPELPAVQQGRVVVLSDDYASIPGPRYITLAERLSKVICAAGH